MIFQDLKEIKELLKEQNQLLRRLVGQRMRLERSYTEAEKNSDYSSDFIIDPYFETAGERRKRIEEEKAQQEIDQAREQGAIK